PLSSSPFRHFPVSLFFLPLVKHRKFPSQRFRVRKNPVLYFLQSNLYDLAATMVRIDLFSFGRGFAVLLLMFHEVVDVHLWLDRGTFIQWVGTWSGDPRTDCCHRNLCGIPCLWLLGRGHRNNCDLSAFISVRSRDVAVL
ncbi:MAG: hypothetical protein WC294_11140, partial [Methanoregula sp.]